MSEDGSSLVTFATAGFLIASVLIFGLVALPELMPTVYPQLRFGTIEIRAVSTSGQIVGPPLVSDMQITVASMAVHRVGVGEGAWITMLDTPTRLYPMEINGAPVTLKETKIPIGEYNLLRLTFGDVTATLRGSNVTLKSPAQELKISTAFVIGEGKRINLIVDLSFDEGAVMFSDRFDPYITVTIEQPQQAALETIGSLKPLASFGPDAVSSGGSRSSTFTVEPGAGVENYLVHAEGGLGVENTFDLEIVETGEFWYDLTGDLWFVGGNLTAGVYHMNVQASPEVTGSVKFAVNLYSVPRITKDLPNAEFSGVVPAESSQSIQVNEFALYLDDPGMYDFYLGVKSGDYEFLVDDNPAAVVTGEQMVTLQLQSGLHRFQIFADFSVSGRDTSWSVGIVPLEGGSVQPLSREAMVATGLLVAAIIVFVADVTVRRLRRKRPEALVSQTTANADSTLRSYGSPTRTR